MDSIVFKLVLLFFLVGIVIFMALADRRIARERLAEERAQAASQRNDELT